MSRLLPRLAVLAALALPGSAVEAGAVDVSLTGCWNSTTAGAKGPATAEICFAQDEHGTITGKLERAGQWVPLRSIKSGGGQVSFVVDGPQGDASVTARYTADAMAGELTSRSGTHAFQAQRKPAG